MDHNVLLEFKHYVYNYLYHKSNIRLAGMMLDVELEGDMVVFYLTAPNVTDDGCFIMTRIKLSEIVKDLEANDDDLEVFAAKYYDIVMEQIIDIELEEKENKDE